MHEKSKDKSEIIKMIYCSICDMSVNYKIILFISFIIIGLTAYINAHIPIMFKSIIQSFENKESATSIYFLLFYYTAIWFISHIIGQMRKIISYRFMEKVVSNLCLRVFSHLHQLSYHYHVNKKTGAVLNALERCQNAIPKVLWSILCYVVPTVIEVLFSCYILFSLYDYELSLILFFTFISYVICTYLFSEYSSRYLKEAYLSNTEIAAKAMDSLLNFEAVKIFNNEKLEEEKYEKTLAIREKHVSRSMLFLEFIQLLQIMIIGIGFGVVTWITGEKVINARLTVPDFILVNGYFLQFIYPLGRLGTVFRDIREGISNLQSVHDILTLKDIIHDNAPCIEIKSLKGKISFKNVDFSYKKNNFLFKNFNLEIPAGSSLGIVGSTGCGKSTLLKLLMRFYDVESGSILIDDKNIKDICLADLRNIMGIVPQEAVLFNGTLLENIAYSDPNASFSEIQKACEIAELKNFIESLPKAYETNIGEMGMKISGGEKQRISIARLVLKKPKIFLFDEASSALDCKTEQAIQKNIKNITRSYTTVYVAHRLSTIQHTNKIIVIHQGKIVESGQHDELLKNKKHYFNLWEKQKKSIYSPIKK